MSFHSLGLAPDLLRAVADQGYTEPTPVQSEAIPFVLAGRDILAGAQTGTGKTAAFVLPILQRLSEQRPSGHGDNRRSVRVLILTPTRELALQVEESVRTYGAHRPVRSTAIYGGVGFDPQVRNLRAGPEIVVATPGRLLDHVGQRTIDLSRVEVLVLDEADRMLDMGFIRDIRRILALLPAVRQNLLFSATFSREVRDLASGFMTDAASVQVTPVNTAAPLVRQVVHPVDRERKRELLSHLVTTGRIDQALVFTRTKHGANRLAEQLLRDGILASAIHGNKSQPQRVRALNDFKAGRVAILVATEVAARGLDIDALPHVVNFELPMVPEDYLHRIGRTGRAGMDGDAVSLVCVDEAKLLVDIERLLGRKIESEVIAGFEPDPGIRPQAIKLRSGMVPQGRNGRPVGFTDRPMHGHAPAGRPNQGRPAAPRPSYGQERPSYGQERTFGARPNQAQGRPEFARPNHGQGRPEPARPGLGQGRPMAARPIAAHPSQGRPFEPRQGQGQGRPAPAWQHQNRPADRQPSGMPQPRVELPGERLSRR